MTTCERFSFASANFSFRRRISSTSSSLIGGGGVLSTLIALGFGAAFGGSGLGGATVALRTSSMSMRALTLAPSLMRSPDFSPTVVTFSPFTKVPLVLPRSWIIHCPLRQHMNACREETSGS